jgi:hypothetical protein
MKFLIRLAFFVAFLFSVQYGLSQCDTLRGEFYKINIDSLVNSDRINNEYGIERIVILEYSSGPDDNIEGTVVIEFDLDSNCAWVNFRIVKSLSYYYDQVVLKAYRSMKTIYHYGIPKCKPIFNIKQPITFKLPED